MKFRLPPNGVAQAYRWDRQAATIIIAPHLAGCIPSVAWPLSSGAGVGRLMILKVEHAPLILLFDTSPLLLLH